MHLVQANLRPSVLISIIFISIPISRHLDSRGFRKYPFYSACSQSIFTPLTSLKYNFRISFLISTRLRMTLTSSNIQNLFDMHIPQSHHTLTLTKNSSNGTHLKEQGQWNNNANSIFSRKDPVAKSKWRYHKRQLQRHNLLQLHNSNSKFYNILLSAIWLDIHVFLPLCHLLSPLIPHPLSFPAHAYFNRRRC